MHPESILKKYCPDPYAFGILLEHGKMVAEKALAIAKSIGSSQLDLQFLEEAALLHDIGVARVHAPAIGCNGQAPYICHGIIGREILEGENLLRHALVCERHIGVGLTMEEIRAQNLPLPLRDMVPISREERIICLADLFFSKKPGRLREEKSMDQVREGLGHFGAERVRILDGWLEEFGL
jgi:uncharacterized protein